MKLTPFFSTQFITTRSHRQCLTASMLRIIFGHQKLRDGIQYPHVIYLKFLELRFQRKPQVNYLFLSPIQYPSSNTSKLLLVNNDKKQLQHVNNVQHKYKNIIPYTYCLSSLSLQAATRPNRSHNTSPTKTQPNLT